MADRKVSEFPMTGKKAGLGWVLADGHQTDGHQTMPREKRYTADEVAQMIAPPKGARSFSSAWEGERLLDGFASIGRVEAELSKAQDDPMDRKRQFEKARHHFKHQWFIRTITLMRQAFYHYGFRIGSEEGKVSPAIKKWERNCRNTYRRYAREAWLEWLIVENVVGLWRRKGGKPPLTFPPERCDFTDIFGWEKIKLRHDITREQSTTIGSFTRTEGEALTKNDSKVLELDHDDKVFGFDICRRERRGSGFGVPAMEPLFTCAAQMMSLEVGDAQLAAACRMVMEQHSMGHEIRSGLHAGASTHFWKKSRAEAFAASVKGKTGHLRITNNFDHVIKQAANWPDPRLWDGKKYDSGYDRMAMWSAPLGQMLLGKNLNPFLLMILRFQAGQEREYMGEHLRTIFVEGLGAPADIKVCWSDKCFKDSRIAADLLKTGFAGGPVSQTAILQEADLDPEEQRELKAEEAKLPKGQTTPIFDAAHGAPDKTKGRTPGSRDGDG